MAVTSGTRKRFGAKSRSKEQGEPFDLTDEHGDVIDTFRTIPPGTLPGAYSFAMAEAIEVGPQGEKIVKIPNITHYIEACLLDKEWVTTGQNDQGQDLGEWQDTDEVMRFRRIIHGKDHNVPSDTLSEIFSWLAEVHAPGRPSGPRGA